MRKGKKKILFVGPLVFDDQKGKQGGVSQKTFLMTLDVSKGGTKTGPGKTEKGTNLIAEKKK